jgi:hypothetical protein
MLTNGITLQVTKTPGITAADFRAEMAEKWQKLTAKTDSSEKTFIPFGKEGDIGYEVMTNIIQQQNNVLRLTKQRIVQSLNDIDCPIDIISGSGEEIDAATISLRDVLYQYKDSEGKQLIDAIEKQTLEERTYFSSMRKRLNRSTLCLIISTQHWTRSARGANAMYITDT